ncbi:hypothetical protein pdam_00008037, partial [Pocillopora damicornis]
MLDNPRKNVDSKINDDIANQIRKSLTSTACLNYLSKTDDKATRKRSISKSNNDRPLSSPRCNRNKIHQTARDDA